MSEDYHNIYKRMCDTIAAHNMFDENDTAVACVSGGCDSVALLLLLCEYSKNNPGFNVVCCHFDHMLRGEESDGDREFVQSLAEKLGVKFYCERKNVAACAEETGASVEMAARELRYAFFNHVAKETGGKIVVAHTGDDRAETVILNIARGTGIHGLRGIRYKRENIVRPLLDLFRSDTEKTCEAFGVSYRNDSSNSETFYKRNRVRLEVLPKLRKEIGEDITEKLLRLADNAEEDDSFLEEEGARNYGLLCVEEENKITVSDPEKFAALSKAVQKRVAARIFEFFYPGRVNVTGKMMDDLSHLIAENNTGDKMDFTKLVKGVVYHDGVIISAGDAEPDEKTKIIFEKAGPEEALAECVSMGNDIAVFDLEALDKYCKEKGMNWEIRTRQEGDEIQPLGAPGRKSLKKLFIDSKVPAYQRNKMPLLAVGNEILWVPGVRRSEVAPIDKNSLTAIIFRCVNLRKETE